MNNTDFAVGQFPFSPLIPPEDNCPFFARRRRAVLRQLLKINGSDTAKLQNACVYRKALSIATYDSVGIEYRKIAARLEYRQSVLENLKRDHTRSALWARTVGQGFKRLKPYFVPFVLPSPWLFTI